MKIKSHNIVMDTKLTLQSFHRPKFDNLLPDKIYSVLYSLLRFLKLNTHSNKIDKNNGHIQDQ